MAADSRASEPIQRPMTVEDAMGLRAVSDPQIAPDGRRVVMERTLAWFERHRGRSE